MPYNVSKMSINHFLDKIKGNQRIQGIDKIAFVYLLVIAGVGIGAVGLYRLSVDMDTQTGQGVIITQTPDTLEQASAIDSLNSPSSAVSSLEKNYVASKNGKLYYTADCSAAKRIKPANQVWFASVKEAVGLGYTPSKTCK